MATIAQRTRTWPILSKQAHRGAPSCLRSSHVARASIHIEVGLHAWPLTSKHLVFPQPVETLCAQGLGGRNFRFRVVVTKIVESLRPRPRRWGGALRPRV